MQKYPLLEAMRAKRAREEAEIAAPYRREAMRADAEARHERAAREGLERIMASEMAPRIVETVAHEMGRGLTRAVVEACAKALKTEPTTTITVPTGMLMYADRDSMVARVVDWWKQENMPHMRLVACKDDVEMRNAVTTLTVRIPEMAYRHVVADAVLPPRLRRA